MKRRFASIYVQLAIGALLAVSLAPGCTTHGEGGRCDPNNIDVNGNFADCDTGLICTPGSELSLPEGGTSEADICCPADRSLATTNICKGSPSSPGSDAGIPEGGFDTGTDVTTDTTTSDVTTDTTTSDVTTDSPIESSTDGPTE